jgi:hypothetical protein
MYPWGTVEAESLRVSPSPLWGMTEGVVVVVRLVEIAGLVYGILAPLVQRLVSV